MPPIADPMGRHIELHDWTWWGHIVKGHPEVRHMRAEVEQTIAAPISIHFSSSDPNCRLFYSISPVRTVPTSAPMSPQPPASPALMICVVADVAAGLVKTAYLAKRIK